jgi:DUF1365 family protein
MTAMMTASVFHARLRPKRHRFRHDALYVLLPEAALARPCRKGLFAAGPFGLFSVRTGDYGDGGGNPLAWARGVLALHEIAGIAEIRLLTMPRILGFGFNPVSFYLCHDREGALRAVLAEVNNTFGERHVYLCAQAGEGAIGPGDRISARKLFHVSPFNRVEGDYHFGFHIAPDRIAITIALDTDEGPLLRTALSGPLAPLTTAGLLRHLLFNPLYPFKVIGLIHYQAVRLFLKGLRHFGKPPPPAALVTR